MTDLVAPPRFALTPAPSNIVAAEAVGSMVFGFQSRDQRSRSFNLLRTQITRFAANGTRLIGITSATPQVGKTFVASNLAASLSRVAELTTTLIDLDLRRGSVATQFSIAEGHGLAEYLGGETDNLAGMAWGIEGQRLVIYPTRQRRIASAELLAGPRFDALIAAMRALTTPAVHLCDLPPVFANDDAMIVAEQLDGYLLVVEDGVTTAKQLGDALRLLGPEKCLGTILNRYVRGLVGGDYGYGYGYGDYAGYYG